MSSLYLKLQGKTKKEKKENIAEQKQERRKTLFLSRVLAPISDNGCLCTLSPFLFFLLFESHDQGVYFPWHGIFKLLRRSGTNAKE
jgi:hypothetical protein